MTIVSDASARQRIRTDLDSTLVVEASAGTGKTTELVARMVALVRTGTTRLSRVAAVTFTEKAAGEMKLRLRSAIERAKGAPEASDVERQRLHEALRELEETRIGTMHGFCADLLRERAVEAGVDPCFQMAAEEDQERIYDEVFHRWYEKQLADPGEGVRRILRRHGSDGRRRGPREDLRSAGLEVIAQRDFDTPWPKPVIDRPEALNRAFSALEELAARGLEIEDKEDFLVRNLLDIGRFVRTYRARESVTKLRDYDGIEAGLRELQNLRSWRWKGSARAFSSAAERNRVLALRDTVKSDLDEILSLLDAEVAACLFAELRPLVESYEAYKSKAGKLDFLDLLILTRDLLMRSRSTRVELQARFSHLLVDEFQDTDPLQADVLLLLASDDGDATDTRTIRPVAGKLFLVGDPKQSIYRFRRADVAFYQAVKRRLVERGATVVKLTTSFRSVPSLQHAINAAFAPHMQPTEDGSQAEYAPLSPCRSDPPNIPTFIALPVPRPYSSYGKVVAFKIEESTPDAIGAFIDFLIRKSGWTLPVQKAGGKPIPIQAQHICILFKRLTRFDDDVTRPYVRALEVRQIPHVLLGGRSLHAREEVTALRNVLSAIEWPEDELFVYASLRGPFFAVTDDALLAYRHRFGCLNPLRRRETHDLGELLSPVQEVLDVLCDLHEHRNRRPFSETVASLLESTRAHAGIAIWPTGEQALGNVLRVLDFARRYEASFAQSFRGFVEWLVRQAERGGAAEAPIVEEGTDGVRLMTVHRAKGLEFPIVILADPTAPSTSRHPSRYVDPDKRLWAMPLCGAAPLPLLENRSTVERHDREEAVRLAYVAATRARDMLVVPVVGDECTGSEVVRGWVDVLHPVVYPRPQDRRSSFPAPGCPRFGDDSVIERPVEANSGSWSSVRPGLHRPEVGEHRVVFWDPRELDLDRQHEVGLRQQRILTADQDGSVCAEGERLHAQWWARRSALLEAGQKPSACVETVTARTHVEEAGARDSGSSTRGGGDPLRVRIEVTSLAGVERPHGKRFGTLVHSVLATVSLDADRAEIDAVVRWQGRCQGATDDELRAAAETVEATLRHTLLRRARSAEECRREVPIVWVEPDGTRIEGVADLAFRERRSESEPSESEPCCGQAGQAEHPLEAESLWIVVDFKTDVDVGAREEIYRKQVAMYVAAITRATGRRSLGYLLRI